MAAEGTTLVFANEFTDSNFRLFEMDESTLQELLKDDGRCAAPWVLVTVNHCLCCSAPASTLPCVWHSMRIKGDPNDEAVLCTATATYTIRLAESSNTLLLGPNKPTKRSRREPETNDMAKETTEQLEMRTSASAHFELLRSAPRIGGLPVLLGVLPYSGNEAEAEADLAAEMEAAGEVPPPPASFRRPTLTELEAAIQCSTVELRAALRDAHALYVNGRWTLVDAQLERDVFETVPILRSDRMDLGAMGSAHRLLVAPERAIATHPLPFARRRSFRCA